MSSTTANGQDSRRLFKPVKLGNVELTNRLAMAPLTRFRADNHIPQDRHATYYSQRASAGLIISEATYIAEEAGGMPHVPGIHSKEQIAGWKKTTEAVHKAGGHIYCQLWALGRANPGNADVPKVVSASDQPFEGGAKPEAQSVEDIKRYVGLYTTAAKNAIEAGFDGVEIHSANGYLLQQYIDKTSNNRTDDYGGSLENRTRFVREVIKSVTDAIGQEKTGIRWSPFGTFQGMAGKSDSAYDDYKYLVQHIRDDYPKFAYVHFVEDTEVWRGLPESQIKPRSTDPFRSILRSPVEGKHDDKLGDFYPEPTAENPTLFIACGDFKTESSIRVSELKGDLIAIGRSYISNPDLKERIENDLPWTQYNRDTFYLPLSDTGYLDYAVAGQRGHGEEAEEKKKQEKENKANM